MIKESEGCALGKDFQPKLQPVPREHTDNARSEVNWRKQGILPPPLLPQYELPPRPPFLQSLLPSPRCSEPESLGSDQVESGVNSLEALGDDGTEKLCEMEPGRTCSRLHYFHKLVQLWNRPNSRVSQARRCD